VFPFSPRASTPAARMPQVRPEIVKERAARLRAAAATRKAAWLKTLLGSTQQIVVEKPGDRGHAPNFAEVHLSAARPELVEGLPFSSPPERTGSTSPGPARPGDTSSAPPVGSVTTTTITAATDDHLIGTIA
jgi:threonylcarbamoyladenosine tRNA methylthiotransferase MtaB